MIGKESVIELGEYLNTKITVQVGDSVVVGKLKSYDRVPNLVLEDAVESSCNDRELGIVLVRGQMISAIIPSEVKEIENPFK
jgi:small nuclear ribonucleoprotein (snRNP)-like protein